MAHAKDNAMLHNVDLIIGIVGLKRRTRLKAKIKKQNYDLQRKKL